MPGCPPAGSTWTASCARWPRLAACASSPTPSPGKTADRPELAACLDYLRAGDTLVVPSLDRLSRSLQDLIGIVAELRRRGVGFSSLHEALDTTTPGGRPVFTSSTSLPPWPNSSASSSWKAPMRAWTPLGPAAAARPSPALTAEQVGQARDLLSRPATVSPRSRGCWG
jgi:Resolvase, N terminal domain